jgi:lipopolysaccharide biosynthesis glycosyltransferase
MFEKITIVSGGNTKYFQLLKELAHSVRDKPEGKDINIVFLDGGLSKEDIDYFKNLNINVINPGWCNSLAERRAKGRDFLKINIAKLYLDQLISNTEIIIWVDADAWIQNFEFINLYDLVARKKKLAIVSQASRLQPQHIQYRKWFFHQLVELRNILYKNARRSGLKLSEIKSLQARPTLNAGSYALHIDAPHWKQFRFWQNEILKKGRLFTSDQLAMGLTIYHDNFSYEALPDICNYMGPWRFSNEDNVFVDYYAPYNPVSVMHLAGQDLHRSDLDHKVDILDLDDKKIQKSLRYKIQN